ncbi:MAG: hypothetical protein COU69_01430 [Candidatus Pacebacteria bacterium CG10_big_fil_rev_8_21_14_0_10_56_10]|nr:MAG: hypothetical protein COU69_01430 [Candidatus Pacebacteria bacterium CG10_big_fil_rev_8_21_14_0_10_56_10]
MPLIAQLFYLFLPAYAANSAPVIGKCLGWLTGLNAPLDQGKTWHGREVLGKHKTVRGLVLAIAAASIVACAQVVLSSSIPQWLPLVRYDVFFWPTGVLMGLGAILGDAAESGIKRLLGIPAGQLWWPFDYFDYTLGALLLSGLAWRLPVTLMAMAIVLNVVLTTATNAAAKRLDLKDQL